MIRAAELADIPALMEIETRCFETDRLSARSFRHMLTKGRATVLVHTGAGRKIDAYALLLFRRATSLARLYSIAVLPKLRGHGIAARLVKACEEDALAQGAVYLRLEVRDDNAEAQSLYLKAGYKPFGIAKDYYEDHADAVRMEKRLAARLAPTASRVPYYAQTLEFTCGPASVMMAMKALDGRVHLDRKLEMRLWRESTTIFMTSGVGGCAPSGLALAAHKRGFRTRIHASAGAELFVGSVRSEEKRAVIRLVQEDMLAQARAARIPFDDAPLSVPDLRAAMKKGWIPIILISSYRLTGDKAPHWVIVAGADERFVYVHDPFVDPDEKQSPSDCFGIPISPIDFERMMRYGRNRDHAAVLISNQPPSRKEKRT